MAGQNKKVTAVLDIQAKITQYQESLTQLQNGLNKLHMPDSLKKGFSDLFVDYQNELNKLQKSSAGGKLNPVNEKEIERSFDKIEGLYNSLIKKLNTSGYKSSILEKDHKAIQAMTEAQKDYNKAVKGADKDLKATQNRIEDINKKLELQKQKASDFAEVSKKANEAEAQKADAAIKSNKALKDQVELVNAAKKAQDEFKESFSKQKGNAKGWNVTSEGREKIKAYNDALAEQGRLEAQARNAEVEHTEAIEAAKKATTDAENAQHSYDKSLTSSKSEVAALTSELKKQQDAYDKLSNEALKNLQEQLDKANINWADYGVDPKTIKSVDDLDAAMDQLQKTAGENVVQVFEQVKNSITTAGDAGQKAVQSFREASNSLHQLAERQKEVDRLSQSILRFFSIDNAVRLFKRSIRSAYETVKDLDKVMTETAVVTDFSVSDMWSQLPEYTKRANGLGVSIHSAYESATIYYQQGLKTNEVIALSNQTLKMARIAGLEAADATDRMTNALRGFNMELNETNAQRVADVYSKLAAISASNVDEISTAMTKVASLASNANMQFETTAAFLSQIIETTRESAETAGTALKTVVARFSEVKKLYTTEGLMGKGNDEEGQEIDVNKVSTALRTAGINLNEYLSGAKGLDDIFIELASKWDSLDKVQQRYIATMAAGSRQQSRFIAMMSDYKRTQELVTAAENANGASNEQYQKTLDSLETKLNQLKNAWDEFTMSLANSDVVKGIVDIGTTILNVLNKITGAFGDFGSSISKILLVIGGLKLGKVFFNKFLDSIVSQFMIGGEKSGQSFISGFKEKINFKNFKGFFKKKELTTIGTQIVEGIKKSGGKPIPLIGENGLLDIDTKATDLAPYAESIKAQFYDKINFDSLSDESKKKIELAMANFTTSIKGGSKTAKDALEPLNKELEGIGEHIDATGDMAKTATQDITNSYMSAAAAASALSMALGLVAKGLDKIGASDEAVNATNDMAKGLGAIAVILTILPALFNALGIAASSALAEATMGISLIITAIITLGFAIAEFIDTDEEKLEKLHERTKESQEAAENAQKAYDDLLSNKSEYNTKLEELNKLIAGTKEWKEKLEEVNALALAIAGDFPELELKLENGILTFDENQYEELLERQVANSKRSSNLARTNRALEAMQEQEIKNNSIKQEQYVKYGFTSDTITSEIGQIILKGLKEGEDNDSITNSLKENGYGILPQNKDLIENFRKLYEEDARVRTFASTGDQSILQKLPSLAGKEAINQVNNNLLSGLDTNISSREGINEISNTYAEKIASGLKERIEQIGEISEEDAREKLEEIGFDTSNMKGNKVIEQYKNLIVTDEYVNNFNNILKNLPEEVIKDVGSILAPSLSNIDFKLKDDEVWDALKALDYSDDEIVEFFKEYENIKQRATEYAGEIKESLSGQAKENFNNLDLTSKNKAASLYDKINTLSAGSGKEQLVSILNKVGNELSEGQFADFINVLDGADLTSWQGVQQVPKLLELAGIDLNELGINVDELTNKLTEATRAAREFDVGEIKKQLKESAELIKDLRGRNSLFFNEEDYQKILANGGNESDFAETADGWQYIGGSMENLITAIEQNTAALTEEANATAQRKQESGELFKSFGNFESEEDYRKFISGELTGKEALNAFKKEGLQEIIDSTTGEIFSIAELTEEKAKQLYDQMYEDYQNLGNNPTIDDNRTRGQKAIADAQNAGINSVDVQSFAESLDKAYNLSEISESTAQAVAAANAKLNAGLEEIIGSYDEWIPLIDESTGLLKSGSLEDQKAIDKLKDSTKKMLNVEGELSDAFWNSKKNMDDLKLAAEGDTEALERLQKAAGMDYLKNLGLGENLQVSTEQAEMAINDFSNWLSNQDLPQLEAGVQWNDEGAQEFIRRMEDMAAAAGWSATDIQKAIKDMGFDAEITMEKTKRDIPIYEQIEERIENGDGTAIIRTRPPRVVGTETIEGTFPVIKTLTSTGSGGGGVSYKNRSGGAANAKKGGGGGGGSSKSDKKKSWKNPYDELYNLTEQINENSRQRNLLEAEYDLMLNDRTKANDVLLKNSYEQLKNLEKELALQKEMQAGRKRQLDNILNETYEDSEGNRKTYKQLGVEGYARYDQNTQTIVIDWEGLEKLAATAGSEEKGKAVEDYIKRLEELSGQFEEIDSKVLEIEKQVQDIRMRGMDDFTALQERVLAAFVKARQDQIDEFQALSDTIADSTSRVIDGIREQVEAERQARQNEKAEEDIADKEARLAYLQRDTSGANDLEIMKLNEELADARQDYTDSLIDQGIEKMQEQADKAQEQRQRQIDLMTAQLAIDQKNGYFNEAVQTAVEGALTTNTGYLATINTGIKSITGTLVQSSDGSGHFVTDTGEVLEAYKGPTGGWDVKLPDGSVAKADVTDIKNDINDMQADMVTVKTDTGDLKGYIYSATGDNSGKFITDTGDVLKASKDKDGKWKVQLPDGSVKPADITGTTNAVTALKETLGTAEGLPSNTTEAQFKWESDLLTDIKKATEGWANFKLEMAKANGSVKAGGKNLTYKNNKWYDANGNEYDVSWNTKTGTFDAKLIKNATTTTSKSSKTTTTASGSTNKNTTNGSGSSSSGNKKSTTSTTSTKKTVKGYTYSYTGSDYGIIQAVEKANNGSGTTKTSNQTYLDSLIAKNTSGLKKTPYYKTGGLVDFTGPAWLDGTKSKPEIVLNQSDSQNFIILKDILSQLLHNPIQSGTQGAGGDNYYEINIDAEIANDYDVDRLASRIKQQIYSDSMYRNVNTLNWQR